MAIQDNPDFLIVDNQTKFGINIFIVQSKDNAQIYQIILQAQSNLSIIDVIDLHSIEAFVMDQNNADVFAIKLLNAKADIVL